MATMVEKVARAVYAAHPWSVDYLESDPQETSWDDCPDRDKDECHIIARAAIEAMREPTPAMVKAATADEGLAEQWGATSHERLIYAAMIDAALAEVSDSERSS